MQLSDRITVPFRRGCHAAACLAGLALALPAAAAEFTVVSVNAWALPAPLAPHRQERLVQLADWLGEVDADLVALQEVWRGAVTKFPVAHQRSQVHRKDDGLGLTGNASLQDFDAMHFRRATGFDALKQKGAVRARVRLDDADVWVVSTHLQAGRGALRASVRNDQIHELITWLDPLDGPVLLVGDLNMDASHPEDQTGWELLRLAGYADLAEQVGATDPTYPGDGRRYDRMMARSGSRHALRAEQMRVVHYDDDPDTEAPPRFSDHRPIVARLGLYALTDVVTLEEPDNAPGLVTR